MNNFDTRVSVLLVVVFALLLIILGMELVGSTKTVITDQTTKIINHGQ